MRFVIQGLLLALFTSNLGFAADPYSVQITKLDAQQTTQLIEDFRSRNPQFKDGDVVLHPDSGWIARAFPRAPLSPGDPKEEDAIRLAREFVEGNHEALGLPKSLLPHLKYTIGKSKRRNVHVSPENASVPYEGYESFPDFTYRPDVELEIGDGAVRRVLNRTNRLTIPVQLNTKPLALETDPRIRENMLARELFYHDFAGNKRSAGKIEENDIAKGILTIHRYRLENGTHWLGLAWRYRVKRVGLPWTFFFSAEDGRLLEIRQDFDT